MRRLWLLALLLAGAGMGNVSKLGTFIQTSMPLGQGGTLTAQEACDLALYINSQPRPVFPGSHPPPGSVYY